MQARCPRCASVFATDRSGLQFCPHCGQQVDVPSFPGAPPESAGAGWGGPSGPGGPGSFGPGAAVREDTPWERRASLGFFTGLFETWKRTIFSPQLFWASVKPNGSWTDALLYGWVLCVVAALLAAPWGVLGMGGLGMQSMLDQMSQLPPETRAALRSFTAGAGWFRFVFTVVTYPLWLIIGAAIQHLFCMLFGVAKNGFYATLRVLAYAGAAHILVGIPCIGVIAGLYGVVLVVLGLSSVQEASVGRAAAAILIPWLLLCCCIGGAAFLGAASLAALMSSHGH